MSHWCDTLSRARALVVDLAAAKSDGVGWSVEELGVLTRLCLLFGITDAEIAAHQREAPVRARKRAAHKLRRSA